MAIKKIRMRPEGTNDYADILHPETSADVVKTTGGDVATDLNALRDNIDTHKEDKATQNEYGHIRLSDIPSPSLVPKTEGMRVLPVDPVTPVEGDMWINSTEKVMKIYLDGKIQTTNVVKPVYLFNNGLQNVPWIKGYEEGNSRLNIEPGYFEMTSSGSTPGVMSITTDNLINLNGVTQVYTIVTLSGANARAHLVVSTVKSAKYTTYDAKVDRGSGQLDDFFVGVGALSGSYYISLQMYGGSYATTMRVYEVWLVY